MLPLVGVSFGTVLPLVLPWSEAAYTHLLHADPPMAALARQTGPLQRAPTRDYFGRLVRAIVGQQISGLAAAAIYRRLVERAVGPEAALPETPSVAGRPGAPLQPQLLARLSDDELRACGLSNHKLLALRDLTARALDGRLDLAGLEQLPDAEVRAQLMAVRGVGRWTADMFLMFALGRPDVLPAADLGIQQAVRRLYALPALPAPKEVIALAERGRWHPFATAASFYLWESLR